MRRLGQGQLPAATHALHSSKATMSGRQPFGEVVGLRQPTRMDNFSVDYDAGRRDDTKACDFRVVRHLFELDINA